MKWKLEACSVCAYPNLAAGKIVIYYLIIIKVRVSFQCAPTAPVTNREVPIGRIADEPLGQAFGRAEPRLTNMPSAAAVPKRASEKEFGDFSR
jgi:hypothetical protein